MANERLIKRRIKSAKNISQITRAMQMEAASKMKKAQNRAISGRPYADTIAEMVSRFVAKIEVSQHPLLRINSAGKTLIILISTNKGLLGGLNAGLFRTFSKWFSADELNQSVFVTLGKKGEAFLLHGRRFLVADFSQNTPFTRSIPALTKLVTDGYIKGEFKKVYLVYSNFISALRQEPARKKILPIVEFTSTTAQKTELQEKEAEKNLEFLIEPSVDQILDSLLINYLENQIRDAVLEAEASEHSARMIAMKNATDNAMELIDLLTLEYNKARQSKITNEIADIVTARMAVD